MYLLALTKYLTAINCMPMVSYYAKREESFPEALLNNFILEPPKKLVTSIFLRYITFAFTFFLFSQTEEMNMKAKHCIPYHFCVLNIIPSAFFTWLRQSII